MNFKQELSPSKPLLYSTQLPILRSEVTFFRFFKPLLNNNHSQTIELEKFDDGYFVDNVVPDYVYILSAVYMAIIFIMGFAANISIFIIFGTSSPAVST